MSPFVLGATLIIPKKIGMQIRPVQWNVTSEPRDHPTLSTLVYSDAHWVLDQQTATVH